MTIRVLLADDQATIRGAFRIILDAQPGIAVVGEAGDGHAAVRLARELRPDVVLADVRMPGPNGLEVTRLLAGPEVRDPVRVIVVTTFDVDEYVQGALRNGACGFLLKRSGPTLLAEAVRAAHRGDTLISPEVTVRLLRSLAPAETRPGLTPVDALTPREADVARLVAAGGSNADIARALFLSQGTVKNHVASIQQKVGARNRVGIAAWAWESRLVR